jgi:preprotein translocase subunit SecF
MKMKIFSCLILIFWVMLPVSAHGIDVTSQSTIVIADNSTGVLAKKTVNEMGLNVTVYNFKSSEDVSHQLEHAVSNPNKKILLVAYQNTANDFLAKNPSLSNRIIVSSADKNDIKNGLNLLTEESSTGFLIPFLAGILVGLISGTALGAFWMKRKNMG